MLEVYLTWDLLSALPEYSRSLPTARTVGKMWRRYDRFEGRWLLHTFDRESKLTVMYQFAVVLIEGPTEPWKNQLFQGTDWSNLPQYARS